jgi:hypothetical protein
MSSNGTPAVGASPVINNFVLGGMLVGVSDTIPIEDERVKCVATLEQSDGSRYWRHLYDHVAGDAVDIERGQFVLLIGSVYTECLDGGPRIRYDITGIRVIDESEVQAGRILLGGTLTATPELISTGGPARCELHLQHDQWSFRFTAKGEVAERAAELNEGDAVTMEISVSAWLDCREDPDGEWRPSFTVEQVDLVPESPPENAGERKRRGFGEWAAGLVSRLRS